MSINKYKSHLYVIPEDDAERQIADGFVLHDRVDTRQVQVVGPPGGWPKVLDTFRNEYLLQLRQNVHTHVVMLIDYDTKGNARQEVFIDAIPEEFRRRVFVVGPSQAPEHLRRATKQSYEQIGMSLANDCDGNQTAIWGHEQLKHNDDQRKLLLEIVKPFLFK